MILKKPYAFLIKNFRIIHMLLTLLIGYVLFRTYNLYNFFSRYVTNVYAALSDAIPSNYINVFMFLVSIIIVVFSLAMYLLMRKKEKPKTFYSLLSSYYIIYLIGLILYFMLFKTMDSSQLTLRNAMIIRDLTFIIALPQVAFFVMSLIRAVGFDIKRFNFSKDLKELDISEEDSEEFEFVLGIDSYKYTRYIRKRLREFKYYILENKFMFTILASLASAVFLIVIILNFTVYNRTYSINQKVYANNLGIQVNNSYITDTDYKGEVIADGKYFVVVNITFTNDSGLSTVLDLQNYVLEAGDERYYPTLSRNDYFLDLGAGYAKEKIENAKTVNYILVYELEGKDVAKTYNFKIIDEVEYSAGTMNSKHKMIALKPIQYISRDTIGTFLLSEPVTMYGSVLNDSSFAIDSFEFANKFTYQYEACIRTNCSNKTDVVTADNSKAKKLLILSGTVNLDNKSTFVQNAKSSLSFFDAFAHIRYDDKISAVSDVTPNSITDKYILQVDESAAKAKKIELVFTVRNKEYVLKLKG